MADNPNVVENNQDNHHGDNDEEEHDPYFEPIIQLPEVHICSLEEDEDCLIRIRAKLFRYEKNEEPHQWKERGTGDVKILYHIKKNTARVLMRRDRTWKICANHYINSAMQLKPNCGSDRAWIWNVPADFADEVPKPELLAVRFANAENANKFKEAFETAQKMLQEASSKETDDEDDHNSDDSYEESSSEESVCNDKEANEATEVVEKLRDLQVAESQQKSEQ